MLKFYLNILFFCIISAGAAFAQVPTITSLNPVSGSVGSTLVINGNNFNPLPEKNVVFLGATKAVVTHATATSVSVIVPPGASHQKVSVRDITSGLTGYSAMKFVPTFPGIKDRITLSDFKSDGYFVQSNNIGMAACGDLDGDGKSDVVTTSYIYSRVDVALNTSSAGDFSVRTGLSLYAGSAPSFVAIADLNGDDKPEIVVTNASSNTVSIFRNSSTLGNPVFVRSDLACGDDPEDVVIDDLDSDGKPDLVVHNNYSNSISVFRNTGSSGNISFAPKVDFDTHSIITSLAIGDLDGDGKADLVMEDGINSELNLFRNTSVNGVISFAFSWVRVNGSPGRATICDLDNDGKQDLATVDSYGKVIVLPNTGSPGNIRFGPQINCPVGPYPKDIATGDLNGDGRPDLVTADRMGSRISIVPNTSSTGNISFAPHVEVTVGNSPFSVATGDMDGDGKSDIISANNGHGSVTVLLNNPQLAPTTQAANLNISDITPTTGKISWTNGNGTAHAVFLREYCASCISIPSLINKTSYSGNSTYRLGDPVGTVGVGFKGWYAIYNGTDTSVTVTGLTAGSSYGVMVVGYDGAAGQELYATYPAIGNPAMFNTVATSNLLGNLSLSSGTLNPSFTSGNISYTASVGNSTNSISITPTMSALGATAQIYGEVVVSGRASSSIPLSVGTNTIPFIVTSQDGNTTQQYTITVKRAVSSIVTLSNLTISTGVLSPAFTSGNTNYNVSVSNSTSQVTIIPTLTNPTSRITVNGIPVSSGSASVPISLSYGTNTITTIVTASDGSTSETYSILVNRVGLPVIQSFTPLSAAAAGTVTITGTNFTGATAVSLGGTAASSFTVNSPTQITAIVASGSSGTVFVTTPAGTATKGGFTFTGSVVSPAITSFTPASAGSGTTVTISGTGFTGATAVSFGGTAATSFAVNSDTQITAVLARGSSGSVAVITPGGTTSKAGFTYIIPVPSPTITSFTPSSGSAGSTVTITGTNLTGATAVTFGGTAASSFVVNSSTQITAIIAGGASGSVSVTTPGGTTSKADFTYVIPIPSPTITSFTPSSSSAGSTVTITGTNLTGATAVTFGGTAASSFVVNSSTQITAIIAGGASGIISVTTAGGTTTRPGFIFVPKPQISASGSTTFPSGNKVILTASPGTGFNYLWTKDGKDITGATSATFEATESGVYTVSLLSGSYSVSSDPIVVKVIFTLPTSNFKIQVTGESCASANNGSFTLTVAKKQNYRATVSRNGTSEIYEFTDSLKVIGLRSGNYNLCVKVIAEPDYQRCFTVAVSEPQNLSVYSSVNNQSDILSLRLSGGDSYLVELNGKVYSTTQSYLEVPITIGDNMLRVTTNKECQGVFETKISHSELSIYPNPFEGGLTLRLPDPSLRRAHIEILNPDGKVVLKGDYPSLNGAIEINTAGLPPGMYLLKLTSGNTVSTHKIIRR